MLATCIRFEDDRNIFFNRSKSKTKKILGGLGMAVDYVFLAIYIVFFFIPSNVWFILNRKDPMVRDRGWEWVMLTSLPELYACIVMTIANESEINCAALEWQIGAFFFPLYVAPSLIRAFKLYLDFKTAQHQVSLPENSMFLRYKWINTFSHGLLVYFLILVVFVLLSIPIYYLWPTPDPDLTVYGQCIGTLIFNVSIQGFIVGIVLTVLGLLLWTVQDAYGIKLEFTIIIAISSPGLAIWILMEFAFQGSWGPFHESHAAEIVFFLIRGFIWLFPMYLVYENKKAAKVDGRRIDANSSDVKGLFLMCLQNDGLATSFQVFTVQSFCSENLIFYKQAVQFELLPANERLQAAQLIRERFLLDSSPLELNIDYGIRQETLDDIEVGNVNESTFSHLKEIVLQQLVQDSFLRWLKSDSFRQAWEQHRGGSSSHSNHHRVSLDKSDDMIMTKVAS